MRLPLLRHSQDVSAWAAELNRVLEVTVSNILQTKQTTGAIHRLPSFEVADLPSAAPAGQMIYVSDETGGAVVAYSDGTDWRRVTDRTVVS